ncbi:Acyl-CoA N-acyltransferase [Apiospora arundinis]
MYMTPPPGIEVRTAQASDIESIVDLLVSAPDDATLYQYPDLARYPDALRTTHRAWVQELLRDPTSLTRITVLGEDVVVGFSSWARRAPNPDNPSGPLQRVRISDPPPLNIPDAEENQHGSSSSSSSSGGALPSIEPHKTRTEAVARVREHLSRTSPVKSIARWSLEGLAVHASHQNRGIGTMLVRWGLEQGAAEGVPVVTAGESRGVRFYTGHSLGFQIVKGTDWWLDQDGRDVFKREVNERESIPGWVSGAQVVWLPPGHSSKIRGIV